MKIEIILPLDVKYEIIPAHEGTTDERIPESIALTSVKFRGVEIMPVMNQDEIEELIYEVSNEILN